MILMFPMRYKENEFWPMSGCHWFVPKWSHNIVNERINSSKYLLVNGFLEVFHCPFQYLYFIVIIV